MPILDVDHVVAWQNRPLEAAYAIVFFDALRVKIRDEGVVKNKAVYLAIGMCCSGHKEILGVWIEQTEGAKLWLRVMSEIRNRGTCDILIRECKDSAVRLTWFSECANC